MAPHVSWVSEKMANVVSEDIKLDFMGKLGELKKAWKKLWLKAIGRLMKSLRRKKTDLAKGPRIDSLNETIRLTASRSEGVSDNSFAIGLHLFARQ